MNADYRKELAAAYHKGGRQAVKEYKSQHPGASTVTVLASVAAVKRRPKDFAGYERRAVALFLTERDSVDLSNAALAAKLSADVPGYNAAPSLLTAPLGARARRAVREILEPRGFRLVDAQVRTLSKVKLALRALYAGEAEKLSFNGKIVFTEDAVIVGGRRHPIQTSGGHRRVHAGKFMLNVDGLKALLSPA
ncbi:hypothetical protein [Sphingomonas nostoxanthinifaciens]|uniref:hypothetical protein n=1 Tax=Sphingomonas nostoxanthinifaciens TaxID=2872652 RepID=UPI001CC20398|nr:hypothetical protein [Sphingomonas nostoxanthinifaciens]UAK25752.1 hypothetical protein K8P63_06365 [Sphingomonas nostoxanthinifaciens]